MSQAVFYYDFFNPEAYLAAERMPQAEWIPVRARDLPAADTWEGFRCAEDRTAALALIEDEARRDGLQAIRWPEPFPFDSEPALRAATFAKSIGKGVAFSLAAFRQAYAGGRPLDDPDTVVIAAAACELHPRAVVQALERESVARALEDATALAVERGVRDVPAVWAP